MFDKIPFLNISRKRPICPIKINDFGILNERLTVFKIELTIDRCKSAFVLSDNSCFFVFCVSISPGFSSRRVFLASNSKGEGRKETGGQAGTRNQ